jgi:hypothetical protein
MSIGYHCDLKKWQYARQQKKQQDKQADDPCRQGEGQQLLGAALGSFVSQQLQDKKESVLEWAQTGRISACALMLEWVIQKGVDCMTVMPKDSVCRPAYSSSGLR